MEWAHPDVATTSDAIDRPLETTGHAVTSPGVRIRPVALLAVVIAVTLGTIGLLAIIAVNQASERRDAERHLVTSNEQLAAQHNELDQARSELARSRSDLERANADKASSQARADDAESQISAVEAILENILAEYVGGDQATPEQARCISNGLVRRLGAARILSIEALAAHDQMPPELERAYLQAAADCVPGTPTA
jgi:cell division protein FtsB